MPPEWIDEQGQRVEELIDGYRAALHDSLNDLTEEEARRRLVPSKTTLLGLVKHASFVEGVWFDQAVTGRSYDDIGTANVAVSSQALGHVNERVTQAHYNLATGIEASRQMASMIRSMRKRQ